MKTAASAGKSFALVANADANKNEFNFKVAVGDELDVKSALEAMENATTNVSLKN